MKLVIEIDEERYSDVKNQVKNGIDNPLKVIIANGTPLPKGHGRLIDADAKDLQSELWTFTRYTGIDEAPYEDACMALDKAPTIVEADGGVE